MMGRSKVRLISEIAELYLIVVLDNIFTFMPQALLFSAYAINLLPTHRDYNSLT